MGVHEVVLGRSLWSSSCIMPKINLRCALSSLLSPRGHGDSSFNSRDEWIVEMCEMWKSEKGCLFRWLTLVILLDLNFCSDFFPVSMESQYLDSTGPHKVSFVQLFLCCPVGFYGFSCERSFGTQSWNSSIEILHQQWCDRVTRLRGLFVCVSFLRSGLSDSQYLTERSAQRLARRSASTRVQLWLCSYCLCKSCLVPSSRLSKRLVTKNRWWEAWDTPHRHFTCGFNCPLIFVFFRGVCVWVLVSLS